MLKPSQAIQHMDVVFQVAAKALVERKHKGGPDADEALLCVSEIACLRHSLAAERFDGAQ